MSRFKSIASLKPRYGFTCVLRGLDCDGVATYCVATWTKNSRLVFPGNWHTEWHPKDDWCLLEIGGYAEDNEIAFEPTHWAEMPKEPDE